MIHYPNLLDSHAALERLNRDEAILVDVRERGEIARAAFDAPHVVHMPLSEFERRHTELPHDREIILACATGNRSFQAMHYLAHRGWPKVANLQGGISIWHAHGLPVKT